MIPYRKSDAYYGDHYISNRHEVIVDVYYILVSTYTLDQIL